MNKSVKKLLITGASLLMLAGLSVGFNGHANASEYHYSKKDPAHAYLQYTHGRLVPNVGRSDDADVGIQSPATGIGYHLYLNGSRQIWSQPGRYIHKRYVPFGVPITSRVGSMQLALKRIPFKAFRSKDNDSSLEIKPRNNKYIGWIGQTGLYAYYGTEGRLPIHYPKKNNVKRNRKTPLSKLDKKAYHIGSYADNSSYDNVSSRLAIQHNPFFEKGFYRAAFDNYMNSPYTPMYNYYNKETGSLSDKFSKDPRVKRQVRKDIRFGLLALAKYYYGDHVFRQGFKMAQGDNSIPIIHKKSFKRGFDYGIKYVFGENIDRKAKKAYYDNTGAIDRDMA